MSSLTLKTLDSALEILKYFTKENMSWGVRELAKEMGKSHSVIHRMLVTYEKHGFLKKDSETQRYELGLKFFEYGLIIQEKLKFKDLVMPYMNKIADQTRESVFLTMVDGIEGVCIAIAEGNRSIKFEVTIGTRTPLYAGASCKSIMAYLPKELQKEIIDTGLHEFTKNTTIDADKLKSELEDIKQKGWSYTTGEYTDDVVGISVPIFDHIGKIFVSLTIAAPSYRITDEVAMRCLTLLQEGSKNIQEQINSYRLTKGTSTIHV